MTDFRFWISLRVHARISDRLDVLLLTIQKLSGEKRSPGDVSTLAPLVFGKAAQIYEGLLTLTCSRSWSDVLDFASSAMPDGEDKLQDRR